MRKGIARRGAQIGMMFLVLAGVLFLAAGTVAWFWGWAYLALFLASVGVNSYFLFRLAPETIVERGRAAPTQSWDKVVSGLWSLFQFFLLPLAAGLEFRLGRTQSMPVAAHLAGALAFAAGLALFGWAMVRNAYFSTAVRIQDDRGQTVCREGPYRYIRHPGYLGAVFQSLGVPLLLGSGWALVPGMIAAVLIIIRTAFEDRMLQRELPGYSAYAGEVRFRLVPHLW
jgi:protein-S-isoprenylcysteine O-methyltransferase Ste14